MGEKTHRSGPAAARAGQSSQPSRLSAAETARRVRAARAYAGLTISGLADGLGIGTQTIKRVEAARRNLRPYELIGIAEICGLPREFFWVDFEVLGERAMSQTEVLREVDTRLERIEQALGVDSSNAGRRLGNGDGRPA